MMNFKQFLNESKSTTINECYRIGMLSPKMDFSVSGGIWFSEKEIDVINFHITMDVHKIREFRCKLVFKNLKIYSRFWESSNGYLSDVQKNNYNIVMFFCHMF